MSWVDADELDELRMQRDAAVAALDIVVRAVYQAQKMLQENVGIILPVDQEQIDACDRQQFGFALEGEDQAFAAADQAFTDAAARDVLENSEWDADGVKARVDLAQAAMDALAGIKKGKGR